MKKNKDVFKFNKPKLEITCKDGMISNYVEKIIEEAEDFDEITGDLMVLEKLKLIELKNY